MVKTSIISIALICLVVFALFFSLSAITVVNADNSRPYSLQPKNPWHNSEPCVSNSSPISSQINIIPEKE